MTSLDPDKHVYKALRMLSVSISHQDLEKVLQAFIVVQEKGEETTLKDVAKIEAGIKEMYS